MLKPTKSLNPQKRHILPTSTCCLLFLCRGNFLLDISNYHTAEIWGSCGSDMHKCWWERWTSRILRAPYVSPALPGLWWQLSVIIASLFMHSRGSLCLYITHIYVNKYTSPEGKQKGIVLDVNARGLDPVISKATDFLSYLQCNYS